jgi:hypothetical protein
VAQINMKEVALIRHSWRGFDCNVEVVTGARTARAPRCFQVLSRSTTCGGERRLASWQTGCITGSGICLRE